MAAIRSACKRAARPRPLAIGRVAGAIGCVAGAILVLAQLSVGASASTLSPRTASEGAPLLYGVTIDRISRLEDQLRSLAALPVRATTRVYFDTHEPASYYLGPVQAVHGASGVMGELLDSSQERAISTSSFRARVHSYLGILGSNVDIWEIGNEVNGNWTGSYPDASAKLTEAYQEIASAGGRGALTLYANDFGPNNCGDGASELTPVQFSEQYVPASVAAGLSYVLLSYYPSQCGMREPSAQELATRLRALHSLYPNAALGFGEVGLPRPATRTTSAKAEQILKWAYSLDPGLPYYVGGYFWWYGTEDALKANAPLGGALAAAFEAEASALGH